MFRKYFIVHKWAVVIRYARGGTQTIIVRSPWKFVAKRMARQIAYDLFPEGGKPHVIRARDLGTFNENIF